MSSSDSGAPIPLVPGAGWALLRGTLGRRRAPLAGAVAVALVSGAAAAAVPTLIQRAIDDGIVAGDPDALMRTVALFGAVAVITSVVNGARIWLLTVIGQNILHDIRVRAASALPALPIGRFERLRRGDVVARLTGDVERLEGAATDGIPFLVASLVATVAAAVGMALVSPLLTLLGLVVVLPLVGANRWLARHSARVYPRARERNGAMIGELAEIVEGADEIRAFGQGRHRRDRFAVANAEAVHASLDGMRMRVRFYSTVSLTESVATALVAAVAGTLALSGQESVGVVAAAIIALNRVYEPLVALISYADEIHSARAALDRVASLAALADDVDPTRPTERAERAAEVPGIRGPVERLPHRGANRPAAPPESAAVELRDVTFAYEPGRPVVHGVSLILPPGSTTALVGDTGAGKSTLARLVSGLAVPDTGSCLVGGVPVACLAPVHRRRLVVSALQEGFCIDGTVADNLRLIQPEATDDELTAALRSVGADPWLAALPVGLETPVGSAGASLSGGQRQLLALARLCLLDPAVLVLDEATSLLDAETEVAVALALERVFAHRTVLIIAHRQATAERCDRVVRLDRGRIVSDGRSPSLPPQPPLRSVPDRPDRPVQQHR